MKPYTLEALISENLSTRQIAVKLDISQTTVRYWLNKYNLKTHPKKTYICRQCGETDKDKFYGNKHTSCSRCHNTDVIERGRAKKQWAVNLLGGKCCRCGYAKSYWALQFHHLNPEIKDTNFKSIRGWTKERRNF